MKRRDVLRYCQDLGWVDPPDANLSPPPAPPSSIDDTPLVDTHTPGDCTDLQSLDALVQGCALCRLAEKRKKVVFGEGADHAPVLFIGEGPGAEEDRTGRPFVGQAGQVLDGMIFALGFNREELYIANVVKCRPPGNRDPQEIEMATCSPYLDRQIELIQPKIIVALGRIAAHRLTGTTKSMRALRGGWLSYKGTPMLATYHPAYLLRNPIDKRAAWDDLKMVKAKLGED